MYGFTYYICIFNQIWLDFCLWWKKVSSFPSIIYWTYCLFPNVYSCFHCHRLIGHISMGLLLGSWFFSLIYVSDFVPVPCCFDYYRICSIFWNQEVWCFHLCFSFSSCLNYLESLLVLNNFPGSSEVIASACNAGDQGLIPGLGRSPGEGNGNPFRYSCLENPMDGGAW